MNRTTKHDTSCLPEPLTRKNANGEIYQRDAVVVRQIQEAVKLDLVEIRRRSKITDKESPGFLKEESLVYLIRHYHKLTNRPTVDVLTESLLRRCASLIKGKLHSLGAEAAKDGYSEIVTELFDRILDLNSDKGDFLQKRFWVALEKLTITVFKSQLKRIKRELDILPLSSVEGNDGNDSDMSTFNSGRRASAAYNTRTLESEVNDRILIHAALRHLKEPLRTAYLLRYYEDWPIENQDPSVPTISRYFNKTPRTIRIWLAKAEKELEAWRQKENKDEYTR